MTAWLVMWDPLRTDKEGTLMDIGWAVAAMQNGEQVRRAVWDRYEDFDDEYKLVQLVTPGDEWKPVFMVTTHGGQRTMFNPSHAQLLADDWELA